MKITTTLVLCWLVSALLSAQAPTANEGFALAVRSLEEPRVADTAAWTQLGTKAATASQRARWMVGIGRVGDAALIPLVQEYVTSHAGKTLERVEARALALTVGLLKDGPLLTSSATLLHGADLALAAGMYVTEGGTDDVTSLFLAALKAPSPPAPLEGTLADAVEAALTYGARMKAPTLAGEAAAALRSKSVAAMRGGAYYFARGPAATSAVRGPLRALLTASDPEVAALSARALSRAEGRDADDAKAVAAALTAGGERVVQVDRMRALAGFGKNTPVASLLLGLASEDPALRRTALETIHALHADLSEDVRTTLAAKIFALVSQDGTPEVRGAAVTAFAALDPVGMNAAWPLLRLREPWTARAAFGAALFTMTDPLPVAFNAMLTDPDRRVRLATLEAARTWLRAPLPESGSTLDAVNLIVAALQGELGIGDRQEAVIFGGDPILLSVGCRVLAKLDELADGELLDIVGGVADAAIERIPVGEVEAWQGLVELAARDDADRGLQRLRRMFEVSKERDIRKRIQQALEARDIEPPVMPKATPAVIDAAPLPNQAIVRTPRGKLTLRLNPEVAPKNVSNFAALVRSGYYDGLLFHRVVPAFVAQVGCPRGDGWGGPGYTIPCEVSDLTYDRGTLGMALAGKDTGGSQWFITHRKTPHLDGRYAIFGQLVAGFDVLDSLVEGDSILGIDLSTSK